MKEYLWESYGQGSYLLDRMPYGDGGEVRRYVEYPLKDDDKWRFNEVTEEKDGYENTNEWVLFEIEENEIKSYIRDVLKPSDLYEESEEKEMNDLTVLSFGVPSELAEEVKSIVLRFEGVPVDTNFKGDQNPLDVAEIERLTTENENLRNELNKGHEVVNNLSDKYNDAKSIIHALLHEISDINNFDNIFEAVFSKEKAKEYEVDNYIKEKYKVTKVKATKTITTNIYVLEKDNDNSYPEGVLENADEDLIDEYFGNYYDDKNEYEFEEERVSAEGLTEDQVRSRYSQEQLFTANDCNDIWN